MVSGTEKRAFEGREKDASSAQVGFPEGREPRAPVQTRCPASCVTDWNRASQGLSGKSRPQCRGPGPHPWVGKSPWLREMAALQDPC